MTGYKRALWQVVSLASLQFGLAACGHESPAEFVAAAETQCLDEAYDKAIPLLRAALRIEPSNAAAHYYLGRCYLAGEDFRPEIAEGEFQTALGLFHANGRRSPITRFSDEYFELIANLDCAKARILKIEALLGYGAPLDLLQQEVAAAAAYVDRARQLKPDAEEVKTLDAFLNELDIQSDVASHGDDQLATPLAGQLR